MRNMAIPSIPVIAFATFAIVTALTGGSSRPDSVWLLILRPTTILCLCAMLIVARSDWRTIRPIPLLLASFAATIALQLVPLPPSLWHGLSGRERYDAVTSAVGGGDLWHPLAIAPDLAWNSLVSLLVPLAAVAGFVGLDDRQRRALIWPVLGLIGFSMLLGLAQILGGGTSPLYWYDVSGRGQLIGLLANRNHQGALLALALPLLRAWALRPSANRQIARTRNTTAMCAAAVIILYVLVLGSRAAVALTLVGMLAAFLIEPAFGRLAPKTRWLILASFAAAATALLAIVLTADRAVSIGRIVGTQDLQAEGRLAALPTLLHMIAQTLPFGTGFGSFVPVFASYEPDALLKPTYFNNAHNDLIELTITGGIPALLVFCGFLGWWGWASYRSFARPSASRSWRALRRASAFGILILMMASLVDYPLRTPLLGAVFAILCCWLAYFPAEDATDSVA